MPFTLCHPAAAIPLARRGLVLSALVVGSMMPDLPYFIPRIHRDHFAHTATGIAFFCLPVGLVILWIFHGFLKMPLVSLFPRRVQARLMPVADGFAFRPWRRSILIVLSLLIGALTHVAWDLITHSNGWAVQHFSLFRLPIFGGARPAYRVYVLLQYGSSVLGAILILYWLARWYRHAPTPALSLPAQLPRAMKAGSLLLVALGALAVAMVYGFVRTPYLSGFRSYDHFLRHAVIAGIFIVSVELVAFSAVWHILQARRCVPSAAGGGVAKRG
jgi:hypothetical protein